MRTLARLASRHGFNIQTGRLNPVQSGDSLARTDRKQLGRGMRSVAGRVPLRWRSSRVTPNLARPPAQRGVEDRRLSRSTRRGAPIRIPPTAEAPAPPGFVGRDALGFGLVATPPLFLCCLPCRVTGIAGRLVFSLQQRISFCLFGRFARCLVGGRPRGVGCCLCSNLGLLCKFVLLALPRFFTLRRALGSRGGNGLACCRFSMAAGPSTSDILNFANINFLASDACLSRSSKFGSLLLLMR